MTRVVPDKDLMATATETAQKLAAKPIGALRACKRLIKQSSIGQLKEAMKVENREFAERLRSAEAKEAFSAFLRNVRPISQRQPQLLRPNRSAVVREVDANARSRKQNKCNGANRRPVADGVDPFADQVGHVRSNGIRTRRARPAVQPSKPRSPLSSANCTTGCRYCASIRNA